MNQQLQQLRERVRQNRAALAKEFGPDTTRSACAEQRLGCTFVAGVRVFDRVTGQEGEVVGGTRENVFVPTSK